MVPAKTVVWDLDRCCQVLPHRGWDSLHSHQQYVWAAVSLTFIHMVLSKFWSVPIWKFNLHSPYYRDIWAYFYILKQYVIYFPRTVCLYFWPFFFWVKYWPFSYQSAGMQCVVTRFSFALDWYVMVLLSRILKISSYLAFFPFIAFISCIEFRNAFPIPIHQNNSPTFSSFTFKFWVSLENLDLYGIFVFIYIFICSAGD